MAIRLHFGEINLNPIRNQQEINLLQFINRKILGVVMTQYIDLAVLVEKILTCCLLGFVMYLSRFFLSYASIFLELLSNYYFIFYVFMFSGIDPLTF